MRSPGWSESLSKPDSYLGNHLPEAFTGNHLLGQFFSPPPRPGPKERGVDSVTHFHGNCLGGKGNISDVRNIVLTHLIKRLRSCFRDANQDVVKATTIGSFKLWPAKINQGNPGALALLLLFFDRLYTCLSDMWPFLWHINCRIWRKRGGHPDCTLWTSIRGSQGENWPSRHRMEHVEIGDLL